MRKHFLLLSLLLLSLLPLSSACGTSTATGTDAPLPTLPVLTPSAMPCTIVSGGSGADAALDATITGNDHSRGPENAPVTVLVYSDYQCTTCALVASNLEHVRQSRPDEVRLVFRHLPLTGEHDKAALAIQAVEAAGMQGKFWEMHDLLYVKQAEWSGLAAQAFPAWAEGQAAGLGMDAAQYQADFQGEAVQAVVTQSVQFAAGASQPTVPLVFINSASPYTGPVDFPNLYQVVRLTALAQRQFTACPPIQVNPLKQYLATLHTEKGDVVVQLYADKTPLAVNSFVFLARSGWYDSVTFYRVTSGVAQTGDPSDTGLGNPGYLFMLEAAAGLKFDRPGVVALMNDGANTNGARFFVTLAAAPQLDGQYTIIGQVLSGLDTLAALAARDPVPGQALPPGDLLLQVTIEEK
jgi:cyclophilin family peptidyl-prolyl cis-trans isomerase/protein-disulfide isomerase